MRLRINDLTATLDDDSTLEDLAARRLKVPRGAIRSIELIRKAIDARRRHGAPILFNYIIEVDLDDGVRPKSGAAVASDDRHVRAAVVRAAAPTRRPVVIGFGPAGMFASLTLARAGYNPIVFERGADIDTRACDVKNFFEGGDLNPESNVQFGEGGAVMHY